MSYQRPILAASSGPLWRLSLNDIFGAVSEAGGEGLEVLVSQDTDTQSPGTLEQLANRHDLPIIAIHAPLLMLTRRVYTTDPMEKIRRTLELARALDVGTIVLHPPYLWQMRYSLWIVHELEDALAGSTTQVTMENMYPIHVGSRRLRFHRYGSLESLHRFPHVTLDTSHLAVTGEDIVEAYRRIEDQVVHVHLSDNRGKGRDSHAPIGEGVLPITDFIHNLDGKALRSVTLEINAGRGGENRGRLESILGSSFELLREHLPSVRRPDGRTR